MSALPTIPASSPSSSSASCPSSVPSSTTRRVPPLRRPGQPQGAGPDDGLPGRPRPRTLRRDRAGDREQRPRERPPFRHPGRTRDAGPCWCAPQHLAIGTWTIEGGRKLFAQVMDTDPRPTAIVCGNAPLAVGAILEATARGVRVPEDVSIVGYDDIEIMSHLPVPVNDRTRPGRGDRRSRRTLILDLVMGREPDYPLEASRRSLCAHPPGPPAATRSLVRSMPTTLRLNRTVSLSSLAHLDVDRRNAPRRHVGNPIRQAKSPENFNPLFARHGIDAVMVPMEIESDRFEGHAGAHAPRQSRRVVVTMPFKARIVPMLEHVDDSARRVGAVNAVRRRPDGTWEGSISRTVSDSSARCGSLDVDQRAWGRAGWRGRRRQRHRFCARGSGVSARLSVTDRNADRAASLGRASRVAAGTPAEPAQPSTLRSSTSSSTPRRRMGPDDGSPVDLVGLHTRLAVVDIVTQPATVLRAPRPPCRVCRAVGGCRHGRRPDGGDRRILGIGPSESRTTAQTTRETT